MALAYNEDQRSLKDTARSFATEQSPIEAFRALRSGQIAERFDAQVWQQLIELGFSGAPFAEEFGGYGFGYMGFAGAFEELGRTLVASPLFSSIALCGSVINFTGTDAQKSQWLPVLISGEQRAALALDEGLHHNPAKTALTATVNGDKIILNGSKTRVIDGTGADLYLVVARSAGQGNDGLSLYLVDASSAGITSTAVTLIDNRNYARVDFNNVEVPLDRAIGATGTAFSGLDKALDRARICLCAEMFAGMNVIFERTVDYLKERKQFGTLIGTFQALQHRAAHMYTEIEMCKSILMLALDAVEQDAANAAQLVSAAKAKINDSYELISNEATQMHGGIGVTDELDVGLFLKRARVSAELLGSSRFHLDRYARLEGF